LRAEFKEMARNIVLRDRQARKLGRSQNTIGEIERAMAWAFRFGQELGEQPIPAMSPEAAIDWELIPPRGRQVLDDMTWSPPGFDVEKPLGLRRVEVDGRERWARVYRNGVIDNRPIHVSGVNPLRKLGLLAPSSEDSELMVLSARGKATCEAYLARSAVRDPNLPPLSLRA
jgi:hypothetical protein